jgi:hypothetical protein
MGLSQGLREGLAPRVDWFDHSVSCSSGIGLDRVVGAFPKSALNSPVAWGGPFWQPLLESSEGLRLHLFDGRIEVTVFGRQVGAVETIAHRQRL